MDTRTHWTNVAVKEARQQIMCVLKKLMDENENDADEDTPADYTCGYTNAILAVAREFKMGFYRKPGTEEDEIRDELAT